MLSRRPPPPIPVTPLPSGPPSRLDYAHPERALLRHLRVPFAALVYFHAGVAWGRRRTGTDTLFKPATGTDFYEKWFVGVPLFAVTLVHAVVASAVVVGFAAKRLARAWLLVPAACIAVWLMFFFYLVIAADGPFP